MVVLSAAVVTTGKVLVARQFVEMTRIRVEGLIGAFQKLVDVGRDHTFIETETVRYVYQPMEALHLLLVTNKSSNILEDLETLRLLAKVVQDCCHTQVNEEVVLKHALDIVFAFDEVISFGHRESVTLSQVKSYTEMDSHEEKLHQMIEQSKINEAREMAKKKQLELRKSRQEAAKNGTPAMEGFGSDSASGPSSMGGGGGGGGGMGGAFQESMSSMSMPGGGGGDFGRGGGGMTMEQTTWTPSMSEDSAATVKPKAGPRKGMTLGKKKPGDLFAGLGAAEPAPVEEVAEVAEQPAAPVVNPLLEPVKVEVKEKVTADLEIEGGLAGEATCNGSFEVTVLDAAKAALVCFKLAPQPQNYKFKVHPALNKASHASNLLEVRQGQPAFPSGGCVKWQLKTSDDSFLPVNMSCWPTPTGDGTQIVLELELTDDKAVLENVVISFPVPPSARPNVSSASPGEAGYRDGQVMWVIPSFDSSEGSGTLEFTANADTASMLPASFVATQSGVNRCTTEILECFHQERKDPISFACMKSVTYELKIGA